MTPQAKRSPTLAAIEDAVAAIARGEIVVVVDDEDRENEGDLIMAAEHATPEKIAFFLHHTSGLICAPITAERWIEPRVRSLATCPSSIGLEGELEIELDLDFEKKAIRVDQGAKSAFPTSTVRGVLKCAGDEMETLELDKIAHTQPRVTLLAKVTFVPPGKVVEKPAAGEGEATGAPAGEAGLGTATVSWEKALLRDAPKDGKVVARVPQGSRVKILEQRDDWYLVSPPKGDTKGWVYRQAIGK